MATYSRATAVAAPLDEVWSFHLDPAALETVSPGWLHLAVERTVGPEGETDPGTLATCARVEASVRPLGVGPRRGWTAVVEACEAGEERAYVRDVMTDGPFARWEHTHAFVALDDDRTLVADRVAYRLPGAGAVSALGWVGLAPVFRHRHRRTRQLLG